MPQQKQVFLSSCLVPIDQDHPDQRCGAEIVKTAGMQCPEWGHPPSEKNRAYVQAILQHWLSSHEMLAVVGPNLMEQFIGWYAIGMVETQDPGLLMFKHSFASMLCKMACLPITDEALEAITAKMGFTMEDPKRADVLNGLKWVRDFTSRKVTPVSAI